MNLIVLEVFNLCAHVTFILSIVSALHASYAWRDGRASHF